MVKKVGRTEHNQGKGKKRKAKSKRKRPGHQETSSDSEYKEGSDDACKDMNSPYKRPKPTPFTQRITHFKYHKRAKLPQNIRVYKGNKDLEDHLGIFSAATEQEEWPMPIWCKIFRQTLGGAARNWFDDLDPKSVESFEELSHKFLEEFSQQKRYAKDPTEIHGIKRGEVVAGSAEIVRPSQEDKGYVRPARTGGLTRARNRGGPREARRNMGVYTPYPRKDTFTPLTKTPKEILAMESISFPKLPPLIGTLEKQNLNKFCDYHGDRGHNTNDCNQLKKQIEEVVASRKLAHLVKDIRRNNQHNGNPGRNGVKVINMIRLEGNRKRSFKERMSGMMNELTFPAIPQS
ncbi:reverse transcriptase domain-containing protein [Tanacetum coccineum]